MASSITGKGFTAPTVSRTVSNPIESGGHQTLKTVPVTGPISSLASDVYAATPLTTGVIAPGGVVTSVIDFDNDHDWFAVTLQAGLIYDFSMNGAGATPLEDPFLELFNASGVKLASDDDGGPGRNAHLAFYATESGTYYISAESWTADDGSLTYQGGYTLTAGLGVAPTSDTVGGTAATAATLVLGAAQTNRVDTPTDRDWFAVDLTAGTGYDFDLTGAAGFDVELLIYDSNGTLIASNDDFGTGTDAHVDFEPETTGRYYLAAHGVNDAAYGQYTITAAQGDRPLLTQSIDWGTQVAAPGSVVKVYFATGSQTIDGHASLGWNAYEIQQVMAVLSTYAHYINLTFVQTTNQAEAQFKLVVANDLDAGVLAYMNPPGGTNAGLGVFARDGAGWDEAGNGGLEPGGLGYATLLHELGHGLGLAHPFDGGGNATVMTGILAEDDKDFAGYGWQNQGVYTVMSYNDGWPGGPVPDTVGRTSGYQSSPMAIDVAALQAKYGANPSWNAGDSVYTLSQTTAGAGYFSVWDTGGNDTLTVANTASTVKAVIDLRPASMFYTGAASGGAVSYMAGIASGITIDAGVTIENAIGGAGDDVLTGNTAANTLTGNAGNDVLDGGIGADTLNGGAGFDSFYVDTAGDVINDSDGAIFAAYSYTLSGGFHSLSLTGSANLNGTGAAGDDSIAGNAGDNLLMGGLGIDTLSGGDGNDVIADFEGGTSTNRDLLSGGNGDDVFDGDAYEVIDGGAGTDRASVDFESYYNVSHLGVTLNLTAALGGGTVAFVTGGSITGLESLTVWGTDAADAITDAGWNGEIAGQGGNDTLSGAAGDDVLMGGNGNDSTDGGDGNDWLFGGLGADTVHGGSGDDHIGMVAVYIAQFDPNAQPWLPLALGDFELLANDDLNDVSADTLFGDAGADTIFGWGGNDSLDGGVGNDMLIGGLGADTLAGGADNDTYYIDNAGDSVIEASGGGSDTVLAFVSYALGAGQAIEVLSLGGTANFSGTGNELANALTGNSGDNALDGGAGADTLAGLAGNDTYFVDAAGDVVSEAANEGSDLINSLASFTLGDNIENLTLGGSAGLSGTGNAGANAITGNSGDNLLDGGAGADTLAGGLGNDTYIVDVAGDVVTEAAGGGTDMVNSLISYVLGDTLESLTLGGSANLTGTGNAGANAVTGNAGDNLLDGGAGGDTLTGLGGNDTYYVDAVSDTVVEASDGGTDTVVAAVSYSLSQFVEKLTLGGTANLAATGNSQANLLTGNSGHNLLDGGLGADSLTGGTGDDTYVVDDAGDVVTEQAGEGNDQVNASVSYVLGANVENLTLTGAVAIDGTGNGLNNGLTGNGAGNRLDGGTGSDTLAGLGGDDTYLADSATDTVIEADGGGNDLVIASVSYSLGDFIEALTLTGSANLTATGNGLNNSLSGNDGNNLLDGGLGADSLSGGAGDDTYIVDNAGDLVSELAGQGTDQVSSALSFTLNVNLETLLLTGSASVDGTGNGLNNTITGNGGNNRLDGGEGADSLSGGAGDDTYVVDDAGDTVTEQSAEGTDQVNASINYVLGGNFENLTLSGSATDGTGNGLNNVIIGNAAANRLDGGAGVDSLIGGAGDDTYAIDNAGDLVTEQSAEGTDQVNAVISYALGSNVENLTLVGALSIDGTGNGLNNAITGNTAANRLDGGAGADSLTGGTGDDTYVVDDAGDLVTEQSAEGTDQVNAAINYVLGGNIENLTLSGSATDGTGNGLNNVIIGNSAANRLDGGAGADSLIGGAGDDTYTIDNAGDLVTEQSAEGTDQVNAAISYALGSNVENLTLVGALSIDGTGNGLNNAITGNAAANRLDGGAGADSLIGGAGDDTYAIDNAGDLVTDLTGEGTDQVNASVSYALGSNVENLTLVGALSIDGTGNGLNNAITGNVAANRLDGGAGADSLIGGAGDDTYTIDNAGDLVTELTGEGTDQVNASVSYGLGSNVENLTLVGALSIDGTGNGLNNVIIGNAAANRLDGGAGADSLTGGAGDDTYVVDAVGDSVIEAADSGSDTVLAWVNYNLGQFVENLTLAGTSGLAATGNALANLIRGNTGSNRLDGGTGADTLAGDLGDDTYVVDDAGDVVSEAKDQGNDTVLASVSFSLASQYIENLTLTGTASLTATGNGLGNVLTGNSGSNVLDGWTGADTLAGGAGNDVYIVDNLGDVVVEGVSAGVDQVQSSVRFTLGDNIERLLLTGTANINGTGNGLVNIITGNDGNNLLDGGAGGDSLTGGLGNDTYVIDDIGDIVREGSGQGTDMIRSSITWNLGAQYIEALVLTGTVDINGTGNSLANSLTGNAGNNLLDGGAGADSLAGGLGNDTYIVENAGDVVTEANNQGSDLLMSSVTFSLTNGQSIETLTLTGTAHINASGNASANVLNGNAGSNILNGGSGADTMAGGAGQDIYVVENIGDVVIEGLNAGTDTVQSAVTYVLGDNVENLTLAGSAAINGTGNGLANTIYGNAGANLLNGMGGIDKLYGRGGDDTYIIDTAGTGASELLGGADAGGMDEVRASVSFNLGFYIETLILTGSGDLVGGGNDLANTIFGNDGANVLKGRLGNDTLSGGLGADQFVFELNAGKDTVADFQAAQNDRINVHALSNGVVNGAGITLSQVGGDTVVDLGGGNTVTILGALQADVFSHMVW